MLRQCLETDIMHSGTRDPHNNCLMLASLAAHAVLGSPKILCGYISYQDNLVSTDFLIYEI